MCFETTTSIDETECVVMGFDTELTFQKLWDVSKILLTKKDIPYIATNPDKVCPTNLPTVLVDCGSICKCLEHATGRQPDITLGKPDPNMLIGILQQKQLQPDQIAMVGDRIYTDIAMAQNAGAVGVLVLSGETTIEVANAAPNPPDGIVQNIGELGDLLAEAQS